MGNFEKTKAVPGSLENFGHTDFGCSDTFTMAEDPKLPLLGGEKKLRLQTPNMGYFSLFIEYGMFLLFYFRPFWEGPRYKLKL